MNNDSPLSDADVVKTQECLELAIRSVAEVAPESELATLVQKMDELRAANPDEIYTFHMSAERNSISIHRRHRVVAALAEMDDDAAATDDA